MRQSGRRLISDNGAPSGDDIYPCAQSIGTEPRLAPFAIWLSWRRAQSAWMPQIPKLVFSSAKTLRRLNEIK